MDEDEATLLAELRALSQSSAAASRFDSDDPQKTAAVSSLRENINQEQESPSSNSANDAYASLRHRHAKTATPPWKKRSADTASNQKDKTVFAGPVVASQSESTFTGERGESTEDADPGAFIRGMSDKASTSRSADGNDNGNSEPRSNVISPAREPKARALPPWKGGKAAAVQLPGDFEIVVAAPPKSLPPPVEPTAAPSMGIKREQENTFNGERGGAAEDAELLALLKEVSRNASASRFNDNSNNQVNDGSEKSANLDSAVESSQLNDVVVNDVSPGKVNQKNKLLPRWEQKKTAMKKNVEVEVVFATPVSPKNQATPTTSDLAPLCPEQRNTFEGERGGPAEDPELLALLRGVSSKASSSRFSDEPDDASSNKKGTDMPQSSTPENLSVKSKSKPIPPWKRNRSKVASTQFDVVTVAVAAPTSKTSKIPTTATPFSASRATGGAAEDPELLAMLRGVSAQASSNRFEDDAAGIAPANVAEPCGEIEAAKTVEANIAIGATEIPKEEAMVAPPPHGIKSNLPSTFTGERGGAAEDAELLALIRGVSSTTGCSRFDDEETSSSTTVSQPIVGKSKKMNKSSVPSARSTVLSPPILEKDTASLEEKSHEKATTVDSIRLSAIGFKSEQTSSFTGERGGAAEDAELLALLKGVSGEAGSSRFDHETELPPKIANGDVAVDSTQNQDAHMNALPPWKRGIFAAEKRSDGTGTKSLVNVTGEKKQGKLNESRKSNAATENARTVVAPVRSEPPMGIKSDLKSTFNGDRGGAAEDAELLALLRGVSNNASSNRFSNDTNPTDENEPAHKMQNMAMAAKTNKMTSEKPAIVGEKLSNIAIDSEVLPVQELSKEEIVEALTNKNWKIRCQAYDSLSVELTNAAKSSSDLVDANTVLEGLDERIPVFVEDSNAIALDKALLFANLYAEHCRRAGESENAANIVTSLLKKNAFSSRPGTLKLAKALTLKLMEVSKDGVASVHEIVNRLITDGLKAKKPKVVQASANMILDASIHFGAANLPIANIISSAPTMLSHADGKIRDTYVKLLAEICRALGSKSALQSLIDGMKKAQMSELDALLLEQPDPIPPKTGLRRNVVQSPAPSGDALTALQEKAKELEAQRFASRPAVDLIASITKTDYSSNLAMPKWSQKVAALDSVLLCGGDKPFKLALPSSSVNYAPLISDMKKLLSHTHFAVVSKAMDVLTMLAIGVGEKLYSHLRPAFSPIMLLSKDKKLTRAVSNCLNCFFGNVLSFESILDKDDGIPAIVDDKKQKNALTRASALEFLGRCVERNSSAGVRGNLSLRYAVEASNLCAKKLGDPDASVRKASISVIPLLLQMEDDAIKTSVQEVIDSLKNSNPRAYKILSCCTAVAPKSSQIAPKEALQNTQITADSHPQEVRPKSVQSDPRLAPNSGASKFAGTPYAQTSISNSSDETPPDVEEALLHMSNLGIAQWHAAEDEGGIVSGLQASKWQLRQDAIRSLAAFVESGKMEEASSDISTSISSTLVFVRERTRGFKETNVNIMKAILELFISLCELGEAKAIPFATWAIYDGASVCIPKISDRKLSTLSKSLLTNLCAVAMPSSVLLKGFGMLKSVKSPVAHEEFLRWFQSFCTEFGAVSIGSAMRDIVLCLLEELGSTNHKVKREATGCFALLHRQIGPGIQALSMPLTKNANVKDQLSKSFKENPHDPSLNSIPWPRSTIVSTVCDSKVSGESGSSTVLLHVPKSDIFSSLHDGITTKLGSKEGKTSWKIRKGAMDEIDSVLQSCTGLIDTAPAKMHQLIGLMRSLRERLNDTQINLRPIAARLVGDILARVDKVSQAKLAKLVFSSLLNSAMNDIKKPMRDASLASIRRGITSSSLDGGDLNDMSSEALVTALVSEVNESSIRAGGLPDVLLLLTSIASSLPNLDDVMSARGQTLGEKYAVMVVECLTSSKADTRAAASSLLEISIEHGALRLQCLRKATERLKPATQRSIGPLLAQFSKSALPQAKPEKENLPATAMDESVNSDAATAQRDVRSMRAPAQRHQVPICATPSTQAHVPKNDSTISKHPLIPRSGKHVASSKRGFTWPDYPEEPSGSVLANLKRFWSPFLPPSSVYALFPTSGIRKQDDAKSGCEILARALQHDRTISRPVVGDQIDLILKWIVYALCSKETTTGLQDLLALIHSLFSYMIETRRELSDSEATDSVPFLIEKSSNAKGRFRETYSEIGSLLEIEALLPCKRLGSVACVTVLDASNHVKARVLACEMCRRCVSKIGLAGVGKRGVLSTAKNLSRESTKYRSSALDLMETILSKMNGDLTRLVRICGHNLSEKASRLLEERWYKNGGKDTVIGPTTDTPGKFTNGGSPTKKTPAGSRADQDPDIYDELPKLSLRNSAEDVKKHKTGIPKTASEITEGTFTFSFQSGRPQSSAQPDVYTSADTLLNADQSGAAASLRARLLKIREKGQSVDPDADSALTNSRANEEYSSDALIDCSYHMDSVRALIEKNNKVADGDAELDTCVSSLKIFHAALSRQTNSNVGLTSAALDAVRLFLSQNVNDVVGLLRSTIGFSFHAGIDGIHEGMLLPLLSLCLATLMALFRDPGFAHEVSPEELALLMEEAGKALLDARLSSSPALSEETGSQMVRAINKLAVQAATSVERHIAFQSLLSLQQRLHVETMKTVNDDTATDRLARIITKLFARVIRAEEGLSTPYDPDKVDIEAIACFLEDSLVVCQTTEPATNDYKDDQLSPCTNLAKMLVLSMLKNHEGTQTLFAIMDGVSIPPNDSALGQLVQECSNDLGMTQSTELALPLEIEAFAEPLQNTSTSQPKTPSRDVASLVSRLGSSRPGEEREAALAAIKKYTAADGDDELRAHLQQLSGPFREFIVEQLTGDHSPVVNNSEPGASVPSVSERIRNLRSRLQATEMAVQTTTEKDTSSSDFRDSTKSNRTPQTPSRLPTPKSSRLPSPSPTKLNSKMPSPKMSKLQAPTGSASLLRERLASRNEGDMSHDSKSNSFGRAAALRARLEAVKHQSKHKS